MKPPKPNSRDQGTLPFSTQSQLKDLFQVERLLNRLSQHDPAKDQLQRVDISPLAKELAQGKRISRVKPQQASATPKPNRPKEDFIAFQREMAASQLTGEGSPRPPQAIPKITGGFRSEAEESVPAPAPAASPPAATGLAPKLDQAPPPQDPSGTSFDPYH